MLKIVGLVGILICLAWWLHMWRFANLFTAKSETLRGIEEAFPVRPFSIEETKRARMRSLRLTTVDRVVAVVFIVLFVALVCLKSA